MKTKRHPNDIIISIIYGMLLAFFMLLVLIWISPSKADEVPTERQSYCALWAREMTRIETQSGTIFGLGFYNDVLRFEQVADAGIATASDKQLIERSAVHFRSCLFLVEFPYLPLPKIPQADPDGWAVAIASLSLGRQGAEPATEPTEGLSGFPDGSPEWLQWCRDNYATWRESDQTVVRPLDKEPSGERVRCPG